MTVVLPADNTSSRRLNNKKNAIQFATVGLGVFVSDGKVPLIPRYNKLDTELTQQEREQAVEDFMQKHDGQEPVHVGATTDIEVVKKMFRRFPDAVPSIACGPSKLVVLDADAKDNGPELLTALFDDHGGVPFGAPVIPTKSGGKHLIFTDPNGTFTNKAGLLKKNYGTDVRGTGGQFVAPGSIREDGKTYGTNADKINFLRAYTAKQIPQLPDFVVERIGAADESRKDEVAPSREREVILQLEQADWDQHEHAFDADPTIAEYDLDALKQTNAEFAALYDSPSEDCSTNRFLAARMVMTEWPDMPVEALSIFFSDWEGAGSYTDEKPKSGEYDDRQIAREWLKNQGLSKPSKGEAFGLVRDDDPTDKAAFLANGGTEERWEAWQERLDREREQRRARSERFADEADRDQSNGFGQLPFVRGDELVANYRPVRWLVQRLIPLNSVGALYGLPNVGKSFVVFDLASNVRRGREWFGRRVKGGDVLYCYAEGAEGMSGRIKAWSENNDSSGGDVALMNKVPNLFKDPKAASKLIAAAEACQRDSGQPIRLIIVDTLAAATVGADGSSDKDMGIVCERLREVATKLECAVLIVHHSGKNEDKGMRGSSVIVGAVDFALLGKEGKGGSIIQVEKMRDAPKGQKISFKLVEVVVGQNENGEPETTCIVRPIASATDMPAVDLDEDDAEEARLTPSDTPDDKLRSVLRVCREVAERISGDTGDKPEEIGLTAGQIFKALNIERRRSGLPELRERTAVPKLLGKLVDAGEILKSGDNRRTEYRLAG